MQIFPLQEYLHAHLFNNVSKYLEYTEAFILRNALFFTNDRWDALKIRRRFAAFSGQYDSLSKYAGKECQV